MENPPFLSPILLGGGLEQLRRLAAFKTTSAIIQQQQHQQQQLQQEAPSMIDPSEPLNFEVEDLLDFPNDDEELVSDEEDAFLTPPSVCNEAEEEEEDQEKSLSLAPTEEPDPDNKKDGHQKPPSDAHVDACPPTASGLCVPPDDLADQLEWLSAFHEDSSYSCDTTLVSLLGKDDNCAQQQAQCASDKLLTASPVSILDPSACALTNLHCPSAAQVPSRARSKRSRAGGRVWSLDTLMPTLVENRLGGAQEDTVFINGRGCGWPRESHFSSSPLYCQLAHPKTSKKAKKMPFYASKSFAVSADGSPPRRCSHCLVQKTPQWRAGPMGPKTLCNACGVRYKSGRLVPEYRPASSPSFVNEVHSNSHRRILEMRRVKEMEEQPLEGSSKSGDSANHMEEELSHSQAYSCMTSPSQTHSCMLSPSVTAQESSSMHGQDDDGDDGEEHNSRPMYGTPGASASATTWGRDEKEESINSSISSSD